jgi:hypothetical protein
MHLTVPPGSELHQCQLVALPSATDIEAIELSHQYTTGSHHFLLFGTDLASIPADLTGQYDCTRGDEPVMQHAAGILYGGQSPKGQVTFPAGVGLKVKGATAGPVVGALREQAKVGANRQSLEIVCRRSCAGDRDPNTRPPCRTASRLPIWADASNSLPACGATWSRVVRPGSKRAARQSPTCFYFLSWRVDSCLTGFAMRLA